MDQPVDQVSNEEEAVPSKSPKESSKSSTAGLSDSSFSPFQLISKGNISCCKQRWQFEPVTHIAKNLYYLFLFSSSAISCLCCLLASKLKLRSVGGHCCWRHVRIKRKTNKPIQVD